MAHAVKKFGLISRSDFVRRLVETGLEYAEASNAYKAVVQLFEDALLSNSKLSLGRIGALVPVTRAARVVKMGCMRARFSACCNEPADPDDRMICSKCRRRATFKVGVKKVSREFCYGEMVRWKFKVYRKFAKRHGVDGRI